MEPNNAEVKGASLALKGVILVVVGVLLLGWLLATPPGLLGKADAVGYAVCHRIEARSFHLGERVIPLCARCSGMFLGAVLGLAYQALRGRRKAGMPPGRVAAVLVLMVLAFGVDGLNSYLHLGFFAFPLTLYQPQNWLRLATGTGMGLVVAALIYPAFNQTLWSRWDRRPALPGLRDLGVLILLASVVDLVVLSENPLVLYPLALISAAGVLLLLTVVYTMVLAMVMRLENRFQYFRQIWLMLVGGFGMALCQIIVLDLVRYLLTGTWDGFHFG